MEKSTLHLILDKGPREGEALEFKPGSRIRIGRVVRGNTFAIKDPGISQKHLSIDFSHETSKWAVSDLDTSNGTFLNHVQIQPSVPFYLTDGDTIGIGEMTSISVKIVEEEEEEIVLGRLRRAPSTRTRKARATSSTRVSKKEEASDLVGMERIEVPKNVGRGRGRRPLTRSSSAMVSMEGKENTWFENNDANDEEKLVGVGGGDVRDEEISVDMDNMTLGEWFDRLERYLPEAINDISEEIILRLRRKAQRFNEFIAFEKN